MDLDVVTLGNEVLREKAKEVETFDQALEDTVRQMFVIMREKKGVGLAAPQVGISRRFFVTEAVDDKPRVFINPEIIETNDEMESMEEGCLSLPGIHESVKRPTKIHVKYIDENYKEHDEWVGGFLARVMQHEFDHLDGKVFIDHLSGLRKQMIKSKVQNLVKGKVHCNYKTVHNRK